MIDKQSLRAEMRVKRREFVAGIPETVRALLFMHPPSPLCDLVPEGSTLGLYYPIACEAPTLALARWFHERGRRIALPWFAARGEQMRFRHWNNPFIKDGLMPDPFGSMQPQASAKEVCPDACLVPLLGFTADGQRLGQGGGHYDRFLAENPQSLPIGVGWDCQKLDRLPLEQHDIRMVAILTPTRFYGPY